ncbi:MAG: T9SS type A sorting domain-containing protein [Bacteroidales bacterium]|nr:T9SS type A sorting domain-containing protein [Bacteroidales bacterium]
MNIKGIIFISLLLIQSFGFSQITPDSLIGTYAGERWFKWEEDTEWTIFQDSVGILNINGCWLFAYTPYTAMGGMYIGGTRTFETAYNFCQGSSINYIHRFHSYDSLTILYNDISPPPPNYHLSSTRFYGKKISDSILVNIINTSNNFAQLNIYPNPFNDHIIIETEKLSDVQVRIINSSGKIVNLTTTQKGENNIWIDTKTVSPGIYVLQLISGKKINSFKIVKL